MAVIRKTPGGSMEAVDANGTWQHVPEAAAAEIERLQDALEMARHRVEALADKMLEGQADGGLLGGRQLKRAVPGIFGVSPE